MLFFFFFYAPFYAWRTEEYWGKKSEVSTNISEVSTNINLNCLGANLSENSVLCIPSDTLSSLPSALCPSWRGSAFLNSRHHSINLGIRKEKNLHLRRCVERISKNASCRSCKKQAIFPEFWLFPVFFSEWFSWPLMVRILFLLQTLKSQTIFPRAFDNYLDYKSSLVSLYIN